LHHSSALKLPLRASALAHLSSGSEIAGIVRSQDNCEFAIPGEGIPTVVEVTAGGKAFVCVARHI
jgi:hypothetical protein